ncbi:MFS transporter [Noviherbaspirillum pedocola]|uniref:MFS transporter n=1 Tax=Noviherbaspirillum pedocola TaxID=2801341 RepID=A0A934W8N1_9BURK|nr:MFS transporter [Noviherbaspirillum pedocola]MBK4737770.1 MFS transporter [Noviherbaspirillum pedocola]
MQAARSRKRIIASLGATQIMAWGSLFYAFSVLGPEILRELGWRPELVFGAFSWGLLVSGLAATPAGALIDRYGGARVMSAGSLLCGAGLILLSRSYALASYYAAWTLLGIGMSATLYEAAFATINRELRERARAGISTLTLFGGFASTVFWPLTVKLDAALGWRDTYLVYGLLQLVLCLPLHLTLPRRNVSNTAKVKPGAQPDFRLKDALRLRAFWLLAAAFALNSFVFTGLAVHLIPLLRRLGHPLAPVVFWTAVIGPMQVLGRIGEMRFAGRMLPQRVGRFTFALLPLSLGLLLLAGGWLPTVALFCVLYGLSNGIMTIVRGTVPLQLFGHAHYGAIAGALAGPNLLCQAMAPLAIASLLDGGLSPGRLLAGLLVVSMLSMSFFAVATRKGKARGVSRS